MYHIIFIKSQLSGPGCSKLTKSLVYISLKFKTLILGKCQNFLESKYEKSSHF